MDKVFLYKHLASVHVQGLARRWKFNFCLVNLLRLPSHIPCTLGCFLPTSWRRPDRNDTVNGSSLSKKTQITDMMIATFFDSAVERPPVLKRNSQNFLPCHDQRSGPLSAPTLGVCKENDLRVRCDHGLAVNSIVLDALVATNNCPASTGGIDYPIWISSVGQVVTPMRFDAHIQFAEQFNRQLALMGAIEKKRYGRVIRLRVGQCSSMLPRFAIRGSHNHSQLVQHCRQRGACSI